MKKTEYIVTSKEGMTPYFRTSRKRDAIKASREAKRLGLAGEIIQR